ncbi:MAG: hypothetical protein DMF39_10330 [Verrucomicrobia bacterium]|nr:MAG: hypothetical protein DMF39_10330 [Verrucomicrobiota bacterium]
MLVIETGQRSGNAQRPTSNAQRPIQKRILLREGSRAWLLGMIRSVKCLLIERSMLGVGRLP